MMSRAVYRSPRRGLCRGFLIGISQYSTIHGKQRCSTSNNDLRLKVSLLQPFNHLLQFTIASLVRQIPGVDQHVTFRQLGRLRMCVRDADDTRLSCWKFHTGPYLLFEESWSGTIIDERVSKHVVVKEPRDSTFTGLISGSLPSNDRSNLQLNPFCTSAPHNLYPLFPPCSQRPSANCFNSQLINQLKCRNFFCNDAHVRRKHRTHYPQISPAPQLRTDAHDPSYIATRRFDCLLEVL